MYSAGIVQVPDVVADKCLRIVNASPPPRCCRLLSNTRLSDNSELCRYPFLSSFTLIETLFYDLPASRRVIMGLECFALPLRPCTTSTLTPSLKPNASPIYAYAELFRGI